MNNDIKLNEDLGDWMDIVIPTWREKFITIFAILFRGKLQIRAITWTRNK
jgi:hypothetical protein